MNKTVLGVFTDRGEAEHAIEEFEVKGYNPKDISIIMKDKKEAHNVAFKTGVSVAESTVSGAATGGVLGGLAGLLIGIGAIAVPGIGALFIGGPIAAALGLTGAAATTVSGALTGALAGGVVGILVGIGIPEDDARIYEQHIKEGGILVLVPARLGEEDDVRAIFSSHGAEQIRTIVDRESVERVEDYDEVTIPRKDTEREPAYFEEVRRKSR
jgi:hypothetical protein